MCDTMKNSTFVRRAVCLVAAMSCVSLCGCPFGSIGFDGFAEGIYAGDVPCLLELESSPEPAEEPFTESLVFEALEDGTWTINGVPVEVGALHLRSLPTADLSFEIVSVTEFRTGITVTYEPRPTLTGIEVDGTLTETYTRGDDRLEVEAEALLTLTDIDGSTQFLITCEGELILQSEE